MAFQQKGTSGLQTAKPTFSGTTIVGTWEEEETTNINIVKDANDATVNWNWDDAKTGKTVTTQLYHTATAYKIGDVLTGTGADTRDWVVTASSEIRGTELNLQTVTLEYSEVAGDLSP